MNDRAPGHMADQAIEWIPIGAIAPSETAMQVLRRQRITEASLEGMVTSIKADGIHLPLLLRPLEAMRGLAKYELVAGERRWRGAELAGLEHVPAIVKGMDDARVLRAQLTENIQRETLTPLEEAEGYRELMKAEGLTNAEALEPIVGKKHTWIYDRLKLLELQPDARQALLDGRLTAYLALPVARAKPRMAAKALAIALRPGMTVRELKSQLTGPGFTANLVGCGFPLDDAELHPEAGSCTACPKRTANCGEFDPSEDDPDVCTDPECFEVKVYRHSDRTRKAHEAAGRRILTGAAAKEIAPKKEVLVGHVDLDQACETDEHSRTYRVLLQEILEQNESLEPVVIEDPYDQRIRELVPVDRARRLLKRRGMLLPAHLAKEPEQPKPQAPARSAEEQQRRERERGQQLREQQERTEAEIAFRQALLQAIYRKATGPLKVEDLQAVLALIEGPAMHAMAQCTGVGGGSANMEQVASRMTVPQLERFLRCALVAQCVNFADEHPGDLLALAKRYRIDPVEFRKAMKAGDRKPAAKKKPTGKKKVKR